MSLVEREIQNSKVVFQCGTCQEKISEVVSVNLLNLARFFPLHQQSLSALTSPKDLVDPVEGLFGHKVTRVDWSLILPLMSLDLFLHVQLLELLHLWVCLPRDEEAGVARERLLLRSTLVQHVLDLHLCRSVLLLAALATAPLAP